MSVMYGQAGSEGYKGRRGGGGASNRGGGRGGSRRDGDSLISPNFRRGGIDGYGGVDHPVDNDKDKDGGSYLDKQCNGGSHPVQIDKTEEMDVEGTEEDLTTKKVRIYVGGLGESVTSDDLCATFSKMGVEIEAVDIIRTKGRSFAYIDFSRHSRDSLPKLFNTYNGCVWKGGRLRLEKAKEDYLARMKREWDEDAQLAINASTANVDLNIEPPGNFKKGITSEKKQLRVFFPRLRKMKSLPFSGTGKHKYSFRRVEVPALPKYFCDCEEHCGSLYRVGEKQIPVVEDQGGGMNKEEIQLMNSVMHKLFATENVSRTARNDVELTKEEDGSVKEIKDLQLDETEDDSVNEFNDLQLDESEGTDDDGLIINVVSRGKRTTWPDQDSKVNKRKASEDGPTHLLLKKKVRNNEENMANESVPIVSGGEGSSQAQLKALTITSGAKNIESQSSAKQFSSKIAWSQKSSWRELVGDRSSSSVTISDILPSTSSKKKKKDKQRKLNTSLNFSNGETEKSPMIEYHRDHLDEKVEDATEAQPTKMDSASKKGGRGSSKKDKHHKFNASPNFSDSENEKSLMHEYQRDHLDKKVEDTTEAQPTKIDSASEKGGRDENEKSPMRECQREQLDKKVEDTVEAQPTKMDSATEKGGRDENEKSPMDEYPEDHSDKMVEDTAEAQPTNIDSASEKGGRVENDKSLMHENQSDQLNKKVEDAAEAQPIKSASASAGRGSTWLHKSSWTELVASSTTSSFSIRQILPDTLFDKQEPAKPNDAITTNSGGSKHDDIIEKRENDSTNAAPGIRIGSDRDVRGTAEASQLTTMEDSNASAPTASKPDSTTKQSLCRDFENLETFSFKRSKESLKEWKDIKKALSQKRKRLSKKK